MREEPFIQDGEHLPGLFKDFFLALLVPVVVSPGDILGYFMAHEVFFRIAKFFRVGHGLPEMPAGIEGDVFRRKPGRIVAEQRAEVLVCFGPHDALDFIAVAEKAVAWPLVMFFDVACELPVDKRVEGHNTFSVPGLAFGDVDKSDIVDNVGWLSCM